MAVATYSRSRSLGRRRHRQRHRAIKVLLGVAIVLVALRIVTPPIVRGIVNRHLARNLAYTGSVGDVSFALLRGEIHLNQVSFDYRERPPAAPGPLFHVQAVELSLAWSELLRARVWTRIGIDRPVLTVIRQDVEKAAEEVEQAPRPSADEDWQKALETLFPIEIAFLEIRGGSFRYLDGQSDPKIDIALTEMDLKATGLRNRPKTDAAEDLPARIEMTARTVGEGRIHFLANADPLATQPRFKLNVELLHVSLPALNDFLQAYGSVKVSQGTFETYLEVSAREGAFEGYVKPFFEELEFTAADAKERNLAQRLWEQIVSLVAGLVKNRERNQVAARVPFAGRFDSPNVGILAAVFSTVRHGFIEALGQGLEGAVKPEPVGEGERLKD